MSTSFKPAKNGAFVESGTVLPKKEDREVSGNAGDEEPTELTIKALNAPPVREADLCTTGSTCWRTKPQNLPRLHAQQRSVRCTCAGLEPVAPVSRDILVPCTALGLHLLGQAKHIPTQARRFRSQSTTALWYLLRHCQLRSSDVRYMKHIITLYRSACVCLPKQHIQCWGQPTGHRR